MSVPQITAPPTPTPDKFGGDPVAFDAAMQAFLNYWAATRYGEEIGVVSWLNARVTEAQDAASSAAASALLTAYKGSWSALAGALAIPAVVLHGGGFWSLNSNTANVAAIEPGVSAQWTLLVNYTRTNLCPDVEFWNGGSTLVDDGIWGKRRVLAGTPLALNTYVEESPWFAVSAGQVLTATCDTALVTTGTAQIYIDVLIYQSDKVTQVNDSSQNPISTSHDFSEDGTTRRTHAISVTAGAGAAWAKARVVAVLSAGSTTTFGYRQPKVERGGSATSYTMEASVDRTGLVLVAQAEAAASASLAFTNLGDQFAGYVIDLQNMVPATDGALLYMRTSSNNGVSFDAGASDYDWAQQYTLSSAGPSTQALSGGGSVAQIALVGNSLRNTASYGGFSGRVHLVRPANTTHHKHVYVQGVVGDATLIAQCSGAGIRRSTAAVNAVELRMSSGNITSGVARLYGVRK